jgi:hypothetical protein
MNEDIYSTIPRESILFGDYLNAWESWWLHFSKLKGGVISDREFFDKTLSGGPIQTATEWFTKMKGGEQFLTLFPKRIERLDMLTGLADDCTRSRDIVRMKIIMNEVSRLIYGKARAENELHFPEKEYNPDPIPF